MIGIVEWMKCDRVRLASASKASSNACRSHAYNPLTSRKSQTAGLLKCLGGNRLG